MDTTLNCAGMRIVLSTARISLGVTLLLAAMHPALAAEDKANPYPSMAPIEQYRMANEAEEIALARSAAPASISSDAEVLVLGEHGFEIAVKGTNGFVCLVERSWLAAFDDPVFWNPHIRGPDCLNAAAVKTVLPGYLERTQWVLKGLSKSAVIAKTNSSVTAHRTPAFGAMGYMMSKSGHLSDTDGHWHPHLMLFQLHGAVAEWGANLQGSPVMGVEGGHSESTVLFIPLSHWSDGSPADMP